MIEYDGTQYCGWQIQEEEKSVQGEIQAAIESMVHHEVKLIGAGRTDAGVHALGQVANFNTTASIEPFSIKRGLNGILPPDIVIHNAENVPLEFHSRFDAKKRWYRYQLHHGEQPLALLRNIYTFSPFPIDLGLMNEAARILVGEHDFSSFRSSQCSAKNPVRTLSKLDIDSGNNIILFDFEAQSFLHNMVRVIVGTLLEVGRGKFTVEDVKRILEARDRTQAGPTAPPHGLILMQVVY